MNVFCWNCHGTGKPTPVLEIHDFSMKITPTMLCIVETQISGARVEALAGTLGYDNSYAISSLRKKWWPGYVLE